MGERATRYSPGGDNWVDVCALCTGRRDEHGWIKEGSPTTPIVPTGAAAGASAGSPRCSSRRGRAGADGQRAGAAPALDPEEQAIVEAAELFNESAYRRTIAGIAKSLGEPRVSILPLSGTNPEVVITIAWDISWYQYRVVFESGQPVRLAERGYELDDLDPRFTRWNGHLGPDGRVDARHPEL